jgi:hypothetical protein
MAFKTTKKMAQPVKIHPAVIAVWASLVAAAHIIPGVPIIGAGSPFTLAVALYPLSGVFFGPLAGALCSAAGGFIGSLIAPHTAWIGPFTFIIGTTAAFTTGCIAWGNWPLITINRRGSFVINGGIIVYLIGTLLWFSQEIGRNVPIFPIVYYSAGFAALILGSIVAGKILAEKNQALKFPILWLCAFGGMIGGATIGNFFSLILLRLPRENWLLLTAQAPIERLIFSFGAAIIGTPLLIGLAKIGIFVGPQEEGDDNPILPPDVQT